MVFEDVTVFDAPNSGDVLVKSVFVEYSAQFWFDDNENKNLQIVREIDELAKMGIDRRKWTSIECFFYKMDTKTLPVYRFLCEHLPTFHRAPHWPVWVLRFLYLPSHTSKDSATALFLTFDGLFRAQRSWRFVRSLVFPLTVELCAVFIAVALSTRWKALCRTSFIHIT